MNHVPDLIQRATKLGYTLVLKDGKPSLKQTRGKAELPTDLLESFKQCREQVIEWMTSASFTKPTPPAVSEWEQCRTCQQHVDPQAMRQAPISLCPLEVPKKQPASATLGKDAKPCPYRR